jgi:hypothetical protein
MGKDAPSPPPAPDYVGAANATAAGNLDAARAQTAANRVNQYTPYGNITYTHDPNTASGPDGGWTQTMQLAPIQQQLLDKQNATSMQLANLMNRGATYVDQAIANPLTANSLPASMVNAGQTGQDALMARFQPMIDQSHKQLENQLANQGIYPGSEAYNNAMRVQNQSENDMRMQAALNGINVGNNAQNQALQIQSALQTQPINILNAVRSGSQVTNPSFQNYNTQALTSGPDVLGATQAQTNYNQGLYNSQVAASNNASSGLLSAGLGIGNMMFGGGGLGSLFGL